MSHRILTATVFYLFLVNGFFIDVGFRAIPLFFVCVPVFIFYIVSGRFKRVSFNEIEKAILFFYAVCIFSCIYSFSYELSARFLMGLVLVFMCYLTARELSRDSLSHIPILRFVFFAFVYSSFFYYLAGFYVVDFTSEHSDFLGLTVEKGIPRFIGLNNDPNISAVALIFPFFFFMFDKGLFSKITFILCFFCIVATLSRGGLLAVMIALISTFVMSSFRFKALFLGVVFAVSSLIAWVYFYFSESLIPILEKRMTGLSTGGGRFEVWANALALFEQRPILGHGIFTFRHVSDINFDMSKFAHNTYLEIMVETGSLGFFSFSVFCFSVLLCSYVLSVSFSNVRFLFPITVATLVSMLSLSLYINPIFIFVVLLNSIFLFSYQRGKRVA